jgi:hypothetical protein
MYQKTYLAFGYYIAKSVFTAGEVVISEPVVDNVFTVGDAFPYVWFYTKGTDVLINLDTQEQITRTAGDCTVTLPYPKGTWRTTLPEDLELWCISPFNNTTKHPPVPNVSVFSLANGAQTIVPRGTKLFLLSASIQIDGKTILAGRQIEFVSGDKTVSAIGDAYGLIFP